MTKALLLLTALSLLPAASAQATVPVTTATTTAPTTTAPVVQTQPALSQSPLLPKSSETVTFKLPLPSNTSAAPVLSISGPAGAKQSLKAVSVNNGVASYETTFAKDGVYTLNVTGQPAQRVVVRQPKNRLDASILHLNFDGAKPLADLSDFGNDGKAVGDVKIVEGKVGKGVAFGNEASYVAFPRSAVLETPVQNMTMSVWVKAGSNKGYSDFFTKGDWNVLKTDAKNSSIDFFTGGWRRGENEVALPKDWVGNWHHLVGVVEGDTSRLYVDGKLVRETEVEGDLKYTPYPWNLGRNAEAPEGRGFVGTLDDVRIYPFALTSQEVTALYQGH